MGLAHCKIGQNKTGKSTIIHDKFNLCTSLTNVILLKDL